MLNHEISMSFFPPHISCNLYKFCLIILESTSALTPAELLQAVVFILGGEIFKF